MYFQVSLHTKYKPGLNQFCAMTIFFLVCLIILVVHTFAAANQMNPSLRCLEFPRYQIDYL